MIPQEKCDGVSRGLREAFGVAEFEDIRIVTGGNATTRVFRVVVKGSPFLLKIIMRTDDPARHYACMRAAAEAGLAPHVWYTNVEDRISITDFVEAETLAATDALTRMPHVLRTLHAMPPFPGVPHRINTSYMFLMNKSEALDGYIEKFQAAKILPKNVNDELFARYAQTAAVYPHRDSDMVSSHNDLFKPDNILFDGRRLWLVDWEAAFLNDRYADLAVVANMIVTNDAEEETFLKEYFGQTPDEYRRARFFLARQAAHMFYAMAFLFLGSSGEPIDWTGAVPQFGDFQQRFWAGDVKLTDNPAKIIYGRLHLERLLQNVQQARFNEALRIVSDREPV